MSMNENALIKKAELTEDEEGYVSQRTWLAVARQQFQETGSAGGAVIDDIEEDEEESVTVEEWVAQASKAEIVGELQRRDVEHDPKSRKDDLGELLVAAVNASDSE